MKLFKITSDLFSIISLIVANLVPLYGAVYFGWNVFSIMFLYWLESAIIGFSTIQKMKRAEGDGLLAGRFMNFQVNGRMVHTNTLGKGMGKLFFIPFFMVHYGMFMFVHLIFLLAFFFRGGVDFGGILLGFLGLCVSHWVSYTGNFIGRGEYKVVSAEGLFFSPYPRIIVMHLTIIIGGGFAMASGGSVPALVLMIVIKTIVDLVAHVIEHANFQKNILRPLP